MGIEEVAIRRAGEKGSGKRVVWNGSRGFWRLSMGWRVLWRVIVKGVAFPRFAGYFYVPQIVFGAGNAFWICGIGYADTWKNCPLTSR